MPAWMTSLLRAEVWVPIPSAASAIHDLGAGERKRAVAGDDADPDHQAVDVAHAARCGIAISTRLAQ